MRALQPVQHGNANRRRSPDYGDDRFIPSRGAMDLDISAMEVERANLGHSGEAHASPAKEEYKRRLASNLFAGGSKNRVLAFNSRPASAHSACSSASEKDTLRTLYMSNRDRGVDGARRAGRPIPQSPERILDAPDLLDDYYLNLLDWNADNILGVALGDSVYLWNSATGGITQLMQMAGEGSHVTSCAWAPGGAPLMAIGTSTHEVQIWDTNKCKLVRCMEGHCGRVGVLGWNGNTFSSGSRDASILQRDVRAPTPLIAKLEGHCQEVCGLKWAHNGVQLASGGNDNLLNVWDERRFGGRVPLFRKDDHKAAVKALAWCPWQKNLLASGGGTADGMIRFWNTHTGAFINAVDTHSQVCALQWSVHDRELVSSHGYSHNQLVLWRYPSMVKVSELTGHTARVLHMAQSPDGTTVVSAAADETLRFWKILGSDKGHVARRDSLLSPSAWTGAKVVR